jgi:hypothetical protein
VDDADGRWLGGALARTRHIYRWTILWRTARILFATGAIDTAGDVRRLIAGVYDDPDLVPAGLTDALAKEQGEESAAISFARMNVLRWEDGYASGQGWDSDVRTPTRLTEESVTFRLARWVDGVLTPRCKGETDQLAWALSEVSLAAWRASGMPPPTGSLAAAVAATKSGWGRWDTDIPLLVLTPDGTGWQGMVVDKQAGERPVTYDPSAGIGWA